MIVPPRFRWAVGVGAATIVAGIVRFSGLTRLELWFDENCTHYIAHHFLDWPGAGPDRWLEVAHTPYFLLLSLWISLVGETVWGLRSFSALIGTLTVLLLGLAGRRLAGARVGVVAAMLAAVHPLHIHYSHEARVYVLWALVSLGVVYALMVAVRSGSRAWWALFGALAWLMVVTHYYALLFLPATVWAAFAAGDRKRAMRQWGASMAGVGLALLPVVLLLVIPHSSRGPKVWLGEVWRDAPGLLSVARSVWVMMPAGGYPEYLGGLAGWQGAMGTVAGSIGSGVVALGSSVVVLIVVGICLLAWPRTGSIAVVERTQGGGGGCARITFALGAMVLCFFLVAMVYSYVAGPAYVAARYDFVVWPAVMIGLAGAIEVAAVATCKTGRGRSIAVALVAGFLSVCSLATTFASRRVELVQGSEAKAELIASRVGRDDLVISVNQYRWFLAYEWSRRGFSASVVSFPAAHDEQICWRNPLVELADRPELEADAGSIVARVRLKLDDGGRAWLVTHGGSDAIGFEVDRILYARLVASGVDILPVDDWSGLAELVAGTFRE